MMKNKKVEANLSMVVSKTFSGLNMNALKYLLPVWVSPLSGVTLRCVFAAIAFWISAMKIAGISLGLGGAILCILAQKSDDLASDALTGNMLCLLSSIAYAVYLVASNRILKSVGMFTVLKYTFAGAAFSSIVVSAVTGFHAPVFSGPLHWFPLSVLLFVLIFPTVVSYLLVPIGLKYLKTTVVAIYGYLILIVATIVSLLVGQDRFSWSQTIAIGMICVSVYLVEVAETKEKPVSNSDKPSSLPPHGS